MSTIDSGHLEVDDGGQEGPEEAGLVGRGEAVDLRAGAGFRCLGCAGCAALCDEHQSDPQMAARSSIFISGSGLGFARAGSRHVSSKRGFGYDARANTCHFGQLVDALVGDASKVERELGWKAKTHWKELADLMVDADIKVREN